VVVEGHRVAFGDRHLPPEAAHHLPFTEVVEVHQVAFEDRHHPLEAAHHLPFTDNHPLGILLLVLLELVVHHRHLIFISFHLPELVVRHRHLISISFHLTGLRPVAHQDTVSRLVRILYAVCREYTHV
jgi:hypothetical protein